MKSSTIWLRDHRQRGPALQRDIGRLINRIFQKAPARVTWIAGGRCLAVNFRSKNGLSNLRNGGAAEEQRGQTRRNEWVPKNYAVRVISMVGARVNALVKPVATRACPNFMLSAPFFWLKRG